ncbi:MAG: transcription termination factor Rho [Planctomycetales bacterium]
MAPRGSQSREDETDTPAPRRTRRPRKTAAVDPAATESARSSDEGRSEASESRSQETHASREEYSRPASEPRMLDFEDSGGGEDFGAGILSTSGGSSSDSDQQGEGGNQGYRDGGRRRRRRRRSRGGGGYQTSEGSSNNNRTQGGQSGGYQGGGYQGGGYQGGQGGGGGQRQRGRSNYRDRNRNRDRNRGDYDRDRSNYSSARDSNAPSIGTIEGILELHPKGYGFLRDPQNNYASVKTDAFVSASLIEKHKLREGVLLKGEAIEGIKGQGPRLRSVETVDGRTLEEYALLKPFDELTAINPFEQIHLETGSTPVTMRVMDLLTPIGKGQRALIVAPPRTGKTMLLQEIANAVSTNHPELHLMVLLIDERPEEVTEMRRRVRGEVIASSMDRDVESHVRIAQLIVERGKRIAEAGGEVFILLDSITRTARAFNKWSGNSGRTMSGGLDVKALDIPKKLFGTARRFDEGGSLTVVATALIDTGSRMDEVIFQEFKGTGNMELVLNRQLADRRIWPAMDIQMSGTRREEKILSPETLEGVTILRRSLVSLNPVEAMEQLIRTLARFKSNEEFLAKIRTIL